MLVHSGEGLVNSIINKLPIELHIPSYQYCGPGTKLKKRLKRGDPGINPLDAACKEHDIAYSNYKDLEHRHQADKVLEEAAWSRFKSSDASLGEKTAAWAVTTTMKTKQKMGMGMKKKRKCHRKRGKKGSGARKNGGSIKKKMPFKGGFVKAILGELIKKKFNNKSNIDDASKFAYAAARHIVANAGGKRQIQPPPRIIPIPKKGGFLPLLPLFAGISALGSLAGAGAAVAKAVKTAQDNKKQLDEAQKHNRTMEAIAMGKKGSSLFLKPYKSGRALFLNKKRKSSGRRKTKKGSALYLKPYQSKN